MEVPWPGASPDTHVHDGSTWPTVRAWAGEPVGSKPLLPVLL